MIQPINNQRNRDLKLVSGQGEIIQIKHGFVYFKLKLDDRTIYFKSDKGNFGLNFKHSEDLAKEKTGRAEDMENVFIDYLTSKNKL